MDDLITDMGGHINMQGNTGVHVPTLHMQQSQNTPSPQNTYVSRKNH